MLFPYRPLFSLPPIVFGYVYFVRYFYPNKDKFDPQSIKCALLGYSRTQKGYKCFDPLSHK